MSAMETEGGFEILEGVTCADIAVGITGRSMETLFLWAGRALMSILLEDPGSLGSAERRTISVRNAQIDLLLYSFLDELLFLKDAERLLLLPERVVVRREAGGYLCECAAAGGPIDRTRHRFGVDVKAVTMHNLEVSCEDGVWSAVVVFDV